MTLTRVHACYVEKAGSSCTCECGGEGPAAARERREEAARSSRRCYLLGRRVLFVLTLSRVFSIAWAMRGSYRSRFGRRVGLEVVGFGN